MFAISTDEGKCPFCRHSTSLSKPATLGGAQMRSQRRKLYGPRGRPSPVVNSTDLVASLFLKGGFSYMCS